MSAPGAWPSPLSAADVAAGGVSYTDVAVSDGGATVWWTENRPAEDGRTVLLRRRGSGPAEEVLPAGFDARTRVHEYGGRCFLPVDDAVVVSDNAEQRLWLVSDGRAVPLTPPTDRADRYAEPVLLPDGDAVVCVRERHGERVTHALVAVALDGSGTTELWTGSDFVAGARVSPDGSRLAFLTWDHPRMPWDGTELRVAPLLPGPALGPDSVVLGGPAEAVFQPEWGADGRLRAVSDRSGWWNLVEVDASGAVDPLWPVEQECGWPMWRVGYASHGAVDDGVAFVHGQAAQSLGVLADGAVRELDLPFTAWSPAFATAGRVVVAIAATPTTGWTVLRIDTATGGWERVAGPDEPDPAWTPVPETVELPSVEGRTTWAHLYPPASPVEVADGPVPWVVLVHGGPTAQTFPRYDEEKAYFTSRGIGVVEVDHGGSTGHGRAYRELLRGRWGEVDVDDCEAVARWLVDTGRASGVAIRGGSAGGWTVLSALTRGGSAFGAGTSYYGVADLAGMAATTHDFESRYLDGLVPPAAWEERSPLTRVDRLDRPLLLLQGLKDPVVPPEQAELMAAALAERGVPHAYLTFPDEAHGFEKAEDVAASLEAELSFYGQVFGFDPPDVPRIVLRGRPTGR
jgi:dipeptidyl aminopeptidase/acylaminoacyl peptidase